MSKATKKSANKSAMKKTKTTTTKVAKKSTKKAAAKTAKKSAAGGSKKKVAATAAAPAFSLEGKKVPRFSGPLTNGKTLSSTDLAKGWTVLYFYPKDNTSGCTLQGQNFRDQYRKFQNLGVQVVGISPDSLKSHEKFKDKQSFPFELLSDEDKSVAEAFKVWKEKSMYGRKYFGVERSTFLVAPGGKVYKEWRKVKVPGHVDEVLSTVKGAL